MFVGGSFLSGEFVYTFNLRNLLGLQSFFVHAHINQEAIIGSSMLHTVVTSYLTLNLICKFRQDTHCAPLLVILHLWCLWIFIPIKRISSAHVMERGKCVTGVLLMAAVQESSRYHSLHWMEDSSSPFRELLGKWVKVWRATYCVICSSVFRAALLKWDFNRVWDGILQLRQRT